MKSIFCEKEILLSDVSGYFILGTAQNCLSQFKEQYCGKVSLAYLDPPFGTGQLFYTGGKNKSSTAVYSDNALINDYITMMRQVLENIYELLSDEGSIYVHLDYRMGARIKLLLDEIFGEKNFRNEIIWMYKSGGRSRTHFSRKHDTLYYYTKSKNAYFNIEAVGKPRGNERRNHMKKGIDDDGRVYYAIRTNGKLYKYYEDDLVFPSDVWDDISHLHQRDSERVNYPTQKPEALLRRIISASSREGDLVLDPFSGSGTTACTATKLGRNWLAIDSSPAAAAALRMRMTTLYKVVRNQHSHALFDYSKHMPFTNELEISIEKHICGNRAQLIIHSTEDDPIHQVSTGIVKGDTFYPETFNQKLYGLGSPFSLDSNINSQNKTAVQIITASYKRGIFEV